MDGRIRFGEITSSLATMITEVFMEIPLKAQVECTDGTCGISVYVLINPIDEKVTHLVVSESSSHVEYIVPVDLVSATIAGRIQLRCSKAELERMDLFIQTRFIEEKLYDVYPRYGGEFGYEGIGGHYLWPYVYREGEEEIVHVPVEHQQIPPGELAVYRGTQVKAKDGYIGRVDEFVINPENGLITHLVMREGHLWGQKDVIIPLSTLEGIRDDTVFLKLDKNQVELLPTFPLHRRWS
jgi:sporulation protein YlmC with PRC-barrel domain